MEPDSTGIMPPNSSSPKTHRRRKGKVWWALWEKSPFGKENKPPTQLSKDGGHEDDRLSHIVSSNETNMPIEPVKSESERALFIQPTPKSSTSGIDHSKLSSSSSSSSSPPKPLLQPREAQPWPLEERTADGEENGSLNLLSKDDEDTNKQLNHHDDGYISSDYTNTATEPDTPPLWFLWERLVQTVRGAENRALEHLSKDGEHENEQSSSSSSGLDNPKVPDHPNTLLPQRRARQGPPRAANRKRAADGKKKKALKFPYKEGGDKNGQFRIDYESDDDGLLESDDESSTHDGWLGNGDQMEDLIMVLRWSRSYRVSIEVAGAMLNKKPEIVKRALKIRAQPDKEEAILLENKPVIGKWWKLGPI